MIIIYADLLTLIENGVWKIGNQESGMGSYDLALMTPTFSIQVDMRNLTINFSLQTLSYSQNLGTKKEMFPSLKKKRGWKFNHV
jgi:hypothetical protein